MEKGEIKIFCDKRHPTIQIRQAMNTDTQKSPGLYIQANGDTTGVEEAFQETNKQYGIRLVASKLQPQEIKNAQRAMHIPRQRYRFQGAPFTRKFLQKETNKMTTKMLPKLHMNRHHPIALRHAPVSRGDYNYRTSM